MTDRDHWIIGTGELNIYRMYRDCILKAFRKYPTSYLNSIASILGVSERTLLRYIRNLGLDNQYSEYKEKRAELINDKTYSI